jgi:hypothetical protein
VRDLDERKSLITWVIKLGTATNASLCLEAMNQDRTQHRLVPRVRASYDSMRNAFTDHASRLVPNAIRSKAHLAADLVRRAGFEPATSCLEGRFTQRVNLRVRRPEGICTSPG